MTDPSDPADRRFSSVVSDVHRVTLHEKRGNVALERGNETRAEDLYRTALDDAESALAHLNDLDHNHLTPSQRRAASRIKSDLRRIQRSIHLDLQRL